MRRAVAVASVISLCLSALDAEAQSLDDRRLLVETWASGLDRPTCLTFIAPGDVFVIQKTNGKVRRVIDGTPVGLMVDLDVDESGTRGGLGIVADPFFETNGFVYVYYSHADGGDSTAWTDNRVERYRFDGTELVEPYLVAQYVEDPGQNNPSAHNGGVLRFGPDDKLYAQVGDLMRGDFTNPRIEQNTGQVDSARVGGIFRLNRDGSVPADNPFVNDPDPWIQPWYVYGWRNSFGMDFDPRSGDLWFGENGPDHWDEITRAVPGTNSGWLKIMGPDARDATYEENGFTAYDESDLVMLSGATYRDPALSFYDCLGIAATGFLDSHRFPEDLRDTLWFGETNHGRLYMADLDATRENLDLSGGLADKVADDASERESLRAGEGFGIVSDLVVGPDGWLYVCKFSRSEILRIRPKVDLYEPVELATAGFRQPGAKALDKLLSSDDDRLRLQPLLPSPRGHGHLDCGFVLNGLQPVEATVIVESSSMPPGTKLGVQAWNVVQQTWTTLSETRLRRQDAGLTADLPDPEESIDPVTRELRLRLDFRGPPSPNGERRDWQVRVDQVRLEVDWQ